MRHNVPQKLFVSGTNRSLVLIHFSTEVFEMANGLLLRLRERELSASPAERNVIAYVSAHPHEVVGLSVRGLADVTFSSPSSILRFCKRLGFAGYKEFQRELIAELALLGDKKDVALEDISMDDSVERIVGKVMKSNVRTIEATARTLDYTVLERCAAHLKRARAGQSVRYRCLSFGCARSGAKAHAC